MHVGLSPIDERTSTLCLCLNLLGLKGKATSFCLDKLVHFR